MVPLHATSHHFTKAFVLAIFKSSTSFLSYSYKRIPMDRSKGTDPLSGLYLGSFGPHGPELLNLTRTLVDGEEMVKALKLTGDANVPAGSVSFRAKTGRKHRLEARDVYPDELGIMARCVIQGPGTCSENLTRLP